LHISIPAIWSDGDFHAFGRSKICHNSTKTEELNRTGFGFGDLAVPPFDFGGNGNENPPKSTFPNSSLADISGDYL
jgi:hypothetical protein